MCGLFGGYSTTLSVSETDRIAELGFASVTRGIDSTGIITCVRKGKRIEIRSRKDVGNAVSFLTQKENRDILYANDTFLIVGHARAATSGFVNRNNAHPIQVNHIVGCHNGTIHAFAPKPRDAHKTSDSRVLFNLIATHGLEDALRQAWTGAYAISYIDTSKQTLNFIRNKDRPLWFMYQKGNQTLYWASERRILDFMANGYYGVSFENAVLIPENELITFDLKHKHLHAKATKIHPFIQPTTPHTVISQTPSVYCRKCQKRRDYCACGDDGTFFVPQPYQISGDKKCYYNTGAPVIEPPKNIIKEFSALTQLVDKEVANIVHKNIRAKNLAQGSYEVYKGFEGRTYTIPQAKKLLDGGCDGCNEVADVADKVHFVEPFRYLCHKCHEDSFAKEMNKGFERSWSSRIEVHNDRRV